MNGANSTEMTASDGRTHRRAIEGSGSFLSLRSLPLELDDFSSIRSTLTPALSPQGVRKNARLSTGYGERGRDGAEPSFSPGEKVAGASRSDEGLRRDSDDHHPALSRARRRRERWARLALAFAVLAIVSSPARADFRVCNKTHALINIAVGTDAGEAFKTEGWWVATPGSCATPVRGPLKSRFVYLYATDIDGVDLVTGTATMCIDRGRFVAYGAENCWRRGLQAVTFAEIDTLDSGDWTTFLTDPRK
jgi:uncharacterized membrane protein